MHAQYPTTILSPAPPGGDPASFQGALWPACTYAQPHLRSPFRPQRIFSTWRGIWNDGWIWANYNNSLIWIKAIKGDDSLTNYDFQWARSELVIIYPDESSQWTIICIGNDSMMNGSSFKFIANWLWSSPITSMVIQTTKNKVSVRYSANIHC